MLPYVTGKASSFPHAVCLWLISMILLFSRLEAAQFAEEMEILRMFYREEDLVITPTRYPKPLSKVAENITVITSDEIELMNAHTLLDILVHTTGIQVNERGGPGSPSDIYIQGTDHMRLTVMIDGITINNLSDNFPDTGAIPAHYIERVEIIKGPASSGWGSSLGGIINVITKQVGGPAKRAGGRISTSYGEKNTGDFRAEAFGEKEGKAGYYLFYGNLMSDGLRPNTSFDEDNLYTKLQWKVSEGTSLILSLGYDRGSREMGETFNPHDRNSNLSYGNDFEYLFSGLSLNHALGQRSEVSLSLRTVRQNIEVSMSQVGTGSESMSTGDRESEYGGTVRFSWRGGIHQAVLGGDFEEEQLKSNNLPQGREIHQNWALFANDTVSFRKVTITPGIRYDQTGANQDFLSPSLGLTYTLSGETMLRGYVARGFNRPPSAATCGGGFFKVPNPDLKVEKVWSIQAGVESKALRYFWLKTTLYWNGVWDAIDTRQISEGKIMAVNEGKQVRQGIEAEIKTVSFHGVSLSSGYVLIDAKDMKTRKRVPDVPQYTYDLSLLYNRNQSLRVYLKGHYIWWNAESVNQGQYDSFLWDINLLKNIYRRDRKTAYAFLTVHNIFNGSQYLLGWFKNPGRWIEAGLTYTF